MNTSESISKIAPALLKAQKAITFAVKDSKNPHFKSTYADLGSVIDACKPALNDAGILFTQMPAPSDAGTIALTTRLIHESGEWIESTATCPLPKNDPQGYGSANTYLRRYALAAAVGLYQDDDDGNAASKPRQEYPRQEYREEAPRNLARSGSVRHTPTDEALVLDPERETIIRLAASAAIAKFRKGDQIGAYEEVSGITEADERLYLWQLLKSESALRAFIKKHAAELREKEGEPA